MRTLPFTTAIILGLSGAVHAQQLSILPQAGLEFSETTLKYNNMNCFSPLGKQGAPALGLRMDYLFKNNHGPMVGLSTSRSSVEFNFKDPETGMNIYQASPGNQRLFVEAGYTFKSKPIYLRRSAAAPSVKSRLSKPAMAYTGRCRGYSSRYYGARQVSPKVVEQQKNKGWSVTIQPMMALALVNPTNPDIRNTMEGNQNVYQYTAGNWNTAVVMGAGFEFGKNDQRIFTVSLNSLTGVGNLNSRYMTSVAGGKATTTTLGSGVSAWSLKAGIPITLYKKKIAEKATSIQPVTRPAKRCGQYSSRCTRAI